MSADAEEEEEEEEEEEDNDDHDDECWLCHDGGELVLCDRCPRSYHVACLGLAETPPGEFICGRCDEPHVPPASTDDDDTASEDSGSDERESGASFASFDPDEDLIDDSNV